MGKPKSARIYYLWVLKNFQGTKWAERALERLNQLDQDAPATREREEHAGQSTAAQQQS